jgi:phage shock protein PspC (stress-responsive transcriptional regulator)
MTQTPTPTPTRRLTRRPDDRIIAGVASGLADYLGLDPVLVRVGFVVLAFAGGVGIVLYGALWLLAPVGLPGDAAPPARLDRGPAFWVAIGLFVLAALAIADTVFNRSIVWPLVLIAAGVALWRSDADRSTAAAVPPPAHTPTTSAASPTPTADRPESPMPATTTETPATAATAPRWTPPPPPGQTAPPEQRPAGWKAPEPRESSFLGRLTIAFALLTVGVAWVLGEAGAITFTAQIGFALALLVVGLGLVVGTWVGRARWLALPAIFVLVPGLLVASLVQDGNLHLGGGIGDRNYSPVAVVDVADQYELGIGQLVVDLSDLDLAGGTVETAAHVGIGSLKIYVPEDASVTVDTSIGAGQFDIFDTRQDGTGIEETVSEPGVEGAGRIRIDTSVSLGDLEVVRR